MLVITGTIAYDYIMDFGGVFSDHILPNQIHKINLSFIADNFAKKRGGTAGNVSYSLSLLNTKHILFTAAGSDFGEYKEKFAKLGINVNHVKIVDNDYTATGFAMTDKKDNQIWGYFYGASKKIKDLKLNSVAKRGDFVLIGPSGKDGSMAFVKQCVSLDISYIFDPGFILTEIGSEGLEFGVKNAMYLVGNDYEINIIKSRLKNYQTLTSNKIIITTLGENGCLVSERGKVFSVKAARPLKIIDPTGAGDAFRAGFLAGADRKFDIKTSAQMGCVLASFAVECYGAQEHNFTKEIYQARYKQTYGEYAKI